MSRVPCHYPLQLRQADLSAHPHQLASGEYRFMKIVAIVLHSALGHFVLCPGTLMQILPLKEIVIIFFLKMTVIGKISSFDSLCMFDTGSDNDDGSDASGRTEMAP